MGLNIIASNHLRELFEHLADHFQQNPLSPLDDEWIVVQSRGMARWLNLELAKRLGIAASIRYLLPKSFCFQLAGLGQETHKASSGYQNIFEDRQRLAWALFAKLPALLDLKAFGPVRQYLHEDQSGLKRFQLAARTAEFFDNYQLYRPEMLQRWAQDQAIDPMDTHEAWQRKWYQALLEDEEAQPLYQTIDQACHLWSDDTQCMPLPRRLTLFGIGTLPPLFLDFVHTISQQCPTSLYIVQPSKAPEHPADQKAVQLTFAFENVGQGEPDVQPTHPLLLSLGRQGREFRQLLRDMDAHGKVVWEERACSLPERDNLLHSLQADLGQGIFSDHSQATPKRMISRKDRSLQVHACHGAMREMEVLRDQLLKAFETMPDLHPQDVVVLVPDIHVYSPYIQAVFANHENPTLHLPYAIADQRLSEEMPLAQALLSLVETIAGRMTSQEVLALLEFSAIRNRFQIEDGDLEVLMLWVQQTRVAWSEDGRHRAQQFNLPAFDENSWRLGLDRLMLSYAMGSHTGLVGKHAPLGHATTSNAQLLGHFAQCLETLFAYRVALAKPHDLPSWAELLQQMLLDFFRPQTAEEEEAMQVVRDSLGLLPEVAQRFALNAPFKMQLVLEPLRQLLRQEGFGSGFITGRITFCALKPMRTIPFKVVCIAGLNDGEFPRRDAPFGFDLMAKARKIGDRNIREDDRYLFLESLLAAEKQLMLSFVGHQPKDLMPLPPSSVLQELLAHLDAAYETQDGQPISQQILIHHMAHPFDRKYFDPRAPQWFSYDSGYYQIAKTNTKAQQTPFAREPLEPPELQTPLPWQQFCDFWVHPARFFCQYTLGIKFPYEEAPLRQAEPLEVDGLLGFQLDQRIFDCRGTKHAQPLVQRLRSEGLLPPGHLGDAFFSKHLAKTTPLIDEIELLAYLPELPFSINLGDHQMEGFLDQITTEARVFPRPGKIQPKTWVTLWLEHLLLQVLGETEGHLPKETLVFGLEKDKVARYRLPPVSQARAHLEELFIHFQAGLSQPMALFDKTSYQFALSTWKMKQPKNRVKKPKEAEHWRAGYYTFNPISQDPYIRLCFEHHPQYEVQPPEAHKAMAELFWFPFFDHLVEVSP